MPVGSHHIRWAPEDSAGRNYDLTVRQEQQGECFAEQSTSTRLIKRQSQELNKAHSAYKECPEWHDRSTARGVTWQSDRHGQNALVTLDSCGTPSGTGKDTTVLTREVTESFEIQHPRSHSVSSLQTNEHVESLPWLSRQVTIGRNSNFHGLTAKDREELGGVEYRSLKVLLKILIGKSSEVPRFAPCSSLIWYTGLFIGLHATGVIGLLPWIIYSPSHYRDYVASQGQDKVWW